MNQNKKMNTFHILSHMGFQFAGGIVYAFGIYMLIERGYTSFEAGICFALVNTISLVFTPFISNYLDNNDKFSLFDVITLLSFISIILMSINIFIGGRSAILILVYIIGNGCIVLIDPIVNSISSKLRNYDIDVPYSPARAVGSASYGIVCIIFGFISEKFSYQYVIFGGIVFAIFIFIVGVLSRNEFNRLKNINAANNFEKEEKISFKEFCKNNMLYIVTCIFMTLIFLGFSTGDNFMLIICENVGGSSKDMGYILGFKAFIEVIPIFVFPYILKKIKLENTLYISGIAFIVKCFLIYIAPNVLVLYIAQIFQGFSYAFIAPGMIEYVNRYLKKREVVRGASLNSLTIGIAGTLSSFASGYFADNFGVGAMNLFSFVVTTIGAVGFIITIIIRVKKTKPLSI